jgi:hypothetical protein
MSFTDPRLPNKTYKTERGLNIALDYLARREAQAEAEATAARAIEEMVPVLLGGQVPVLQPEPVVLDHIRNIHGVVVRVRIRDEERDKSRSITLQPRGQRGDIAKLSATELASTDYSNNVGTLFEPLAAEDAGYAMYQQSTNQQRVHAAADILRTETGERYETAVTVQESLAKRSITVGEVVDVGSGSTQEHKTVVVRKQPNAAEVQEIAAPRRSVLPGTQDHPTSQGLRSKEEAERISAEYVRTHKSEEGPGAALAGFKTPKSFSVETTAVIDPSTRTPIQPVTGADNA